MSENNEERSQDDESSNDKDMICKRCGKSYEGLHLQQIKCHKMLCVQDVCRNEWMEYFEEEHGDLFPDFDRSKSMALLLRQYYGPHCWRSFRTLRAWASHNLRFHGVPRDDPMYAPEDVEWPDLNAMIETDEPNLPDFDTL